MACATLKRSWNLDSVYPAQEMPSKRARFDASNTGQSISSSSSNYNKKCNLDFSQMNNEQITNWIEHESFRLNRKQRGQEVLFTFKQVHDMCSRLVKEREDQLEIEYHELLNKKLNEQYETFVRFSRDQLQKHVNNDSPPTYLS